MFKVLFSYRAIFIIFNTFLILEIHEFCIFVPWADIFYDLETTMKRIGIFMCSRSFGIKRKTDAITLCLLITLHRYTVIGLQTKFQWSESHSINRIKNIIKIMTEFQTEMSNFEIEPFLFMKWHICTFSMHVSLPTPTCLHTCNNIFARQCFIIYPWHRPLTFGPGKSIFNSIKMR